jgi:hypothetical protein
MSTMEQEKKPQFPLVPIICIAVAILTWILAR